MIYTYMWLREDGTPYYVGKGTHRRYRRMRRGLACPPMERVLIQEFLTNEDALFAEMFLIAIYGRKDIGTGILINRTDGGEGGTGTKHSEEWRKAVGKKLQGNKNSLGHKRSDEYKRNVARTSIGRKISDEAVMRRQFTRYGPNYKPKGLKGVWAKKKYKQIAPLRGTMWRADTPLVGYVTRHAAAKTSL